MKSKTVAFLGHAGHDGKPGLSSSLFYGYQEHAISEVSEEEDTPDGSESSRAEGLAAAKKMKKSQASNP